MSPIAGSSPRAGRRPVRPRRHRRRGGLIPASGETTCARSCCTASARAHPRERGDDILSLRLIIDRSGSSPRAGRRRTPDPLAVRRERLIPASGETTTDGATPSIPARAHPRERGDDARKAFLRLRSFGSSPRAGRRPGHGRAALQGARLIPASGETTRRPPWACGRRAAHPRERGDDSAPALGLRSAGGSSPRAGRRHALSVEVKDVVRLIPASGETTRGLRLRRRPTRAHPRERGDDRASRRRSCWIRGSSPRAGRRRLPPHRNQPLTLAHPRERGDDRARVVVNVGGDGSSPRAGRRPRIPPPKLLDQGLIPASGETTRPTARPPPGGRAHPRERGDDRGPPAGHFPSAGSSPRAREPRR